MKCNDEVGRDDLRRSNGNGGRGIGRRMREGVGKWWEEEGDWAMARGIDKVSGWWKFVGRSREASRLMEMGEAWR